MALSEEAVEIGAEEGRLGEAQPDVGQPEDSGGDFAGGGFGGREEIRGGEGGADLRFCACGDGA
jgi:hypothetical protein